MTQFPAAAVSVETKEDTDLSELVLGIGIRAKDGVVLAAYSYGASWGEVLKEENAIEGLRKELGAIDEQIKRTHTISAEKQAPNAAAISLDDDSLATADLSALNERKDALAGRADERTKELLRRTSSWATNEQEAGRYGRLLKRGTVHAAPEGKSLDAYGVVTAETAGNLSRAYEFLEGGFNGTRASAAGRGYVPTSTELALILSVGLRKGAKPIVTPMGSIIQLPELKATFLVAGPDGEMRKVYGSGACAPTAPFEVIGRPFEEEPVRGALASAYRPDLTGEEASGIAESVLRSVFGGDFDKAKYNCAFVRDAGM